MSFRRPSAATRARFAGALRRARRCLRRAGRRHQRRQEDQRRDDQGPHDQGRKQIANSTLTGTQIKNGSIAAADLDAALTRPARDARPRRARRATRAPAGPNVVPADGVTAAGVKDGSLAARDLGRYATTLNDLDFGTILNAACKSVTLERA